MYGGPPSYEPHACGVFKLEPSGLELSTRHTGVEVRNAGGISQGNLPKATGCLSRSFGPAKGRSSPSWPSIMLMLVLKKTS